MQNVSPATSIMGQYFKIVNVDKKEVVTAWGLGSVAKFWEWFYNYPAGVFVWLLRKSDGDGGGDIPTEERTHYITLGRWAGDRMTLIGDYDSSELWYATETQNAEGKSLPDALYTDISALVRSEINDAIRRDGSGPDEEW